MKEVNDIVKISVVMSAYNSEQFIKEAIDSILSQTFSDFEFIIINDASTDATESIIRSYSDSRIKLINNVENLGLTKSLNIGLKEAKGKYIARMDADDISLPKRFQKQFDFMEQNLDVDVCGTWYEFFGERTGSILTPESNVDIKGALFFHDCIAHPTVIIRKESFEKYKIRYNEGFMCAQDYELWCREIDRLKYANISEVLLKYRLHENQVGNAKRKEQDNIADMVRIRNLQNVGIGLTEKESSMYLDVLKNIYEFESIEHVSDVSKIFDKIGKAGKNKHGLKFQEIIRNHLENIAENGIKTKKTSLKLFFSIFLKWNVFSTNRSKLRYIYHSLRNVLHV